MFLTNLAKGQLSICNLAVALSSLEYIGSGYIINRSSFICGLYIGMLLPYMHVKKFEHMPYFWHLSCIFVAGA